MHNITFHDVDASRWDDLERLFESRGGPKSCWCMVWRAGAKTAKGPDRKAAMKRYVSEGVPIGLLGYSNGEPVAWCSIAPRTTYRDLGGPANGSERPEDVWSLVCFFIRSELRGKGLTSRIIEAAVQHALAAEQKSSRHIRLSRDRRAIVSWDTCRHFLQQGFVKSAEREHAGM